MCPKIGLFQLYLHANIAPMVLTIKSVCSLYTPRCQFFKCCSYIMVLTIHTMFVYPKSVACLSAAGILLLCLLYTHMFSQHFWKEGKGLFDSIFLMLFTCKRNLFEVYHKIVTLIGRMCLMLFTFINCKRNLFEVYHKIVTLIGRMCHEFMTLI